MPEYANKSNHQRRNMHMYRFIYVALAPLDFLIATRVELSVAFVGCDSQMTLLLACIRRVSVSLSRFTSFSFACFFFFFFFPPVLSNAAFSRRFIEPGRTCERNREFQFPLFVVIRGGYFTRQRILHHRPVNYPRKSNDERG